MNLPAIFSDALPEGIDLEELVALYGEQSTKLLAETVDIATVQEKLAESEGVVAFLSKVTGSTRAVQLAIKARLGIQRHLGGLISEQGRNVGGRPRKTPAPGAEVLQPPTLAEQGISEHDSRFYRRLAAIPPEQYERSVERLVDRNRLSLSAVLRDAAKVNRSDDMVAEAETHQRVARYLTKASALGGDEGKWAKAHLDLLASDGPANLARWRTTSVAQKLDTAARTLAAMARVIERPQKNARKQQASPPRNLFSLSAAEGDVAMAPEGADLGQDPEHEAKPSSS